MQTTWISHIKLADELIISITILHYCVIYLDAVAHFFAAFGQGTATIWLDNVNCAGTETRLIDCPSNDFGVHNCIHAEDAGVTCSSGKLYLQGFTHSDKILRGKH